MGGVEEDACTLGTRAACVTNIAIRTCLTFCKQNRRHERFPTEMVGAQNRQKKLASALAQESTVSDSNDVGRRACVVAALVPQNVSFGATETGHVILLSCKTSSCWRDFRFFGGEL